MASDTARESMSEKRLAELLESFRDDERLYEETNDYGKMNYSAVGFRVARAIIPALLAEVERRRAREAALEEIVRVVANGTAPTRHANYLIFHETGPSGMVTGVELRKQARALLASK